MSNIRPSSPLVGRRVMHADDTTGEIFTVLDVVYDEKLGRWDALIESDDSGHIVQVVATKLTTSIKSLKPRKEAA